MGGNALKLPLIIIFSVFYFLTSFSQSQPYRLSIHNPELAGQTLSIAYYYGKSVLLHGETEMDEKGYSRYNKIDHKGIYLLIINDSTKFEFLVSDTGDYILNWKKRGWELNSCRASVDFNHYFISSRKSAEAIDSLRLLAKTAPPEEKSMLRTEIQIIKNKHDSLTKVLAKTHKRNFAGHYFKALIPVSVPELSDTQTEISDSAIWLTRINYFRHHFLDPINWEEPGLIYTPLIEEKIISYLGKIVPRDYFHHFRVIDSLANTIRNEEMREYVLNVLVRYYRRSLNDPNNESAYIYLIDHYFTESPPSWTEPELLKSLQTDVFLRKSASLGQRAPEIVLPDRSGKRISLSNLDADAIVLLFWDYSCPSCQRILDDFRKTIGRYNYKDIQVYTVFIGSDKEIWEAWLERKLHSSWSNTILYDQQEILRQYHIEKTPMLFLLSKEKLIIDKGITVPELERYLSSLSY